MTDRPVNLRLDEQLCSALYAALGSVTRSYRPLLAQIGLTLHLSLGAVRGQLHRGPGRWAEQSRHRRGARH